MNPRLLEHPSRQRLPPAIRLRTRRARMRNADDARVVPDDAREALLRVLPHGDEVRRCEQVDDLSKIRVTRALERCTHLAREFVRGQVPPLGVEKEERAIVDRERSREKVL